MPVTTYTVHRYLREPNEANLMTALEVLRRDVEAMRSLLNFLLLDDIPFNQKLFDRIIHVNAKTAISLDLIISKLKAGVK